MTLTPSFTRTLLLLLFVSSSLFGLIDLRHMQQDFVLETKQIKIPGYPNAFNPSIIRWQNKLLLSFRLVPDRTRKFHCSLGLVWLDENFDPISEPQLLETNFPGSPIESRIDDARLIAVDETLWLVYADNKDEKVTRGGFRVYIGQIECIGNYFFLNNQECLSSFEGESLNKREKNWTPFDYKGNLLLAYSLNPHLIFQSSNISFYNLILKAYSKPKAFSRIQLLYFN